MIIIGNVIHAEEGYTLQKISNKEFVGDEYNLGYIYYKDGIKLDVPYLETPEDFAEVSKDVIYGRIVTVLIREQYTESDEFAIQRQRDEKPDTFKEYYDYCEECKREAKKKMEEGAYI